MNEKTEVILSKILAAQVMALCSTRELQAIAAGRMESQETITNSVLRDVDSLAARILAGN